jgi:hypothetical protein
MKTPMTLAEKLARLRIVAQWEKRLAALKLRYFDWEDAGKADKFERVYRKIYLRIRSLDWREKLPINKRRRLRQGGGN